MPHSWDTDDILGKKEKTYIEIVSNKNNNYYRFSTQLLQRLKGNKIMHADWIC